MAQPLRSGAPLRGLAAYGEPDRDVFFGRERDRDEIVRMLTGDGFRAGLVYGEPGVGKTSLLQAALVPALQEKGATVIVCNDPAHVAQSFADGVMAAGRGGMGPHQGEAPSAYIGRFIANASHSAQYFFIIDDVEAALAHGGEKAVVDLAEMFTRVLARAGGRARILFLCASAEVHALGHLERRTGSLFPPASRYELQRLTPADATTVLDRILTYGGVTADAALVELVVGNLARRGGVLPAELQVAALALRDLRVSNVAQLQKLGGAGELESEWLHAAARAAGAERTGLRVLGEIASATDETASAAEVAARLGVGDGEVERILVTLEDRGVVVRAEAGWGFRHPVLAPRIRELTAPARAAARRAYDLLGSKAQTKQRLTLRDLWSLRSEQIAPTTDAERAAVARSKRFYLMIAGAIAAVPIVILILIWMADSGRVYYDLEPTPGGDRIMVRSGRSGLSGFSWLPGDFEEVVADTGLSRAMVDPGKWKSVRSHDIGADRDGWGKGLDKLLRADLAALLQYATTGDETAITTLSNLAKTDDDRAELLVQLRPIARGTPAEVALVEQSLGTPSPSLQKAAVAVAGAAAQRGADVYRNILVSSLVSADPELRRIALTAVRGIGGDRARELFNAALGKDPDPAARRELMLEVAVAAPDDQPSADAAVATLADGQSTEVQRDQAKEALTRALAADRAAALTAIAGLLGNEEAPEKIRVYAAELLLDVTADERDDVGAAADAARAAFGGKSDELRAEALPLYARADPSHAVEDLNDLATRKPRPAMRIAIATAWGELARSKTAEASAALDKLIKDQDPDVRAAAAAAYGYLGRVAQEPLTKMVKNERYDVAVGAAHGLAASAEVGASLSVAINGIFQLWKQKGKPRRDAARVFARIARRKPSAVVDYLNAAAHMQDDPDLHPIGVAGLCNAANAGSAEARAKLARVTDDPSIEVRRMVIRCVADGKDPGKNGVKIAASLINDSDDDIRATAARVLALGARAGKVSNDVASALIRRLRDPNREVRLIAMNALPALGPDAVKAERDRKDKGKGGGVDPISAAFEAGDEAEKLALLHASRELGSGELVQIAISDASPLVRVETVDLAIATDPRVAATMATALADADPQVRRAALERIAGGQDKLEPAAVERALALGIGDPDPALSQLALTTLARVADKDAVVARLGRALASRTESDRAKAAAAAIGLVERDPAKAIELLTPLLSDPSRDVRAAMLPALGAAWATTNSPEQLAKILSSSERDAMKRLTAAAAFVILARTEGGRSAAEAALGTVSKRGPAMARRTADLSLGLVTSGSDGIGFLQQLVP